MHTAISCATCSRPLRIPSSLLGQTVRCPYCVDAFVAVADPNIKLEEKALDKPVGRTEHPVRAQAVVAVLLEPEPPVVEEAFTVDLKGPAKPPKPAKGWTTPIYLKMDSDRRLWGEMQAEIGSEGVRLYRGRKEIILFVGSEATWVGGSLVRVVVGSRTLEFQLKKWHIYKSRLAEDIAGFLNGKRPMPVNQGYGWPWYQWLILLLPLGLFGVLLVGELPETSLKPLKGFGVFLLALLGPILAYALWHIERLPVRSRWVGASLLVTLAYVLSVWMYLSGPNLPPAADRVIWTSYRPPNGRFSINMPAPPLVEYEHINDTIFVKSIARVKPNQTFVVVYADEAFVDAWFYVRTLYPRALMHSESSIRQGDISGSEMKVDPGTGRGRGTMTVRTYEVGSRLYILIVNETIGINGTRFLDSFQLDDQGFKK